MSNKRTKKKTKIISLIAVAIGGLLLLVTAIVLYQTNRSTGGGTPVLTVDQQRIDYSDVKFNVEKAFTIKVTNTGDGILRFKEAPYIEVLEGC
jgi:hypothetical protein